MSQMLVCFFEVSATVAGSPGGASALARPGTFSRTFDAFRKLPLACFRLCMTGCIVTDFTTHLRRVFVSYNRSRGPARRARSQLRLLGERLDFRMLQHLRHSDARRPRAPASGRRSNSAGTFGHGPR